MSSNRLSMFVVFANGRLLPIYQVTDDLDEAQLIHKQLLPLQKEIGDRRG